MDRRQSEKFVKKVYLKLSILIRKEGHLVYGEISSRNTCVGEVKVYFVIVLHSKGNIIVDL